ncbi:MAG TPA: c-type cytochrome [Blastocatellia bacterium]|nr:c-type cytochrome [Blastocatellia bacterium]
MKPRLRCCALLLFLAGALALAATNPQSKADDATQGRKIYNGQCALCHGIDGTGGRGPALNQPKLQRATNDGALFKIIQNGIPGSEMPDFWQLTDREIRLVAKYVRSLGRTNFVKLPGDATRGQQLYENNCANCHMVRGQGGISGPELTEIGLRRSPAYLREAVLNPNATLPEGFLVVRVVTADGQTVRGVRVNEDSFTLQLRDASSRFHSFRKAEVKEIRKEFDVSPMPSYKEAFSAAELDDLIAYLYSLRGDK